VLTRAVILIAHECTLAARSWRRQPWWPVLADLIKAVKPSLLAASTLACALRHERPSAPSVRGAHSCCHSHCARVHLGSKELAEAAVVAL